MARELRRMYIDTVTKHGSTALRRAVAVDRMPRVLRWTERPARQCPDARLLAFPSVSSGSRGCLPAVPWRGIVTKPISPNPSFCLAVLASSWGITTHIPIGLHCRTHHGSGGHHEMQITYAAAAAAAAAVIRPHQFVFSLAAVLVFALGETDQRENARPYYSLRAAQPMVCANLCKADSEITSGGR